MPKLRPNRFQALLPGILENVCDHICSLKLLPNALSAT
jgi:hypothetical protein